MHLARRHEPRELVVDRLFQNLAPEHPGIAIGTGRTDCRTIPASRVAPVVAMNPSAPRRGFSVHRASAAGAQQDRSQWIGVFGPGLAGSPDVALLDFLAGLPGLRVDQGGVEALDELAVDHDLAGVGRIADQILENVPREAEPRTTLPCSRRYRCRSSCTSLGPRAAASRPGRRQ